jgi:hypothetical protein
LGSSLLCWMGTLPCLCFVLFVFCSVGILGESKTESSLIKTKNTGNVFCMYVYRFQKFFYVARHIDSVSSYLPTGLRLGFFRSWPSLFLPFSFSYTANPRITRLIRSEKSSRNTKTRKVNNR